MPKRPISEKPKPKLSAYACFINQQHETLKHLNLPFDEFSKQCSEVWRNLNDQDRIPFEEQSRIDGARFDSEMIEWNSQNGSSSKESKSSRKNSTSVSEQNISPNLSSGYETNASNSGNFNNTPTTPTTSANAQTLPASNLQVSSAANPPPVPEKNPARKEKKQTSKTSKPTPAGNLQAFLQDTTQNLNHSTSSPTNFDPNSWNNEIQNQTPNSGISPNQPVEQPAHSSANVTRPAVVAGQNNPSSEHLPKKRRRKIKKDPNEPTRPPTAFFIFANANRAQIREANPGYKVTDVSKELGRLWREVDAETKNEFQKLADKEREEYRRKMEIYNANKQAALQEEKQRMQALQVEPSSSQDLPEGQVQSSSAHEMLAQNQQIQQPQQNYGLTQNNQGWIQERNSTGVNSASLSNQHTPNNNHVQSLQSLQQQSSPNLTHNQYYENNNSQLNNDNQSNSNNNNNNYYNSSGQNSVSRNSHLNQSPNMRHIQSSQSTPSNNYEYNSYENRQNANYVESESVNPQPQQTQEVIVQNSKGLTTDQLNQLLATPGLLNTNCSTVIKVISPNGTQLQEITLNQSQVNQLNTNQVSETPAPNQHHQQQPHHHNLQQLQQHELETQQLQQVQLESQSQQILTSQQNSNNLQTQQEQLQQQLQLQQQQNQQLQQQNQQLQQQQQHLLTTQQAQTITTLSPHDINRIQHANLSPNVSTSQTSFQSSLQVGHSGLNSSSMTQNSSVSSNNNSLNVSQINLARANGKNVAYNLQTELQPEGNAQGGFVYQTEDHQFYHQE